MSRTEELGIEIEDHAYDRGYFAAFNGETRPTDNAGREGWADCRREMKLERSEPRP